MSCLALLHCLFFFCFLLLLFFLPFLLCIFCENVSSLRAKDFFCLVRLWMPSALMVWQKWEMSFYGMLVRTDAAAFPKNTNASFRCPGILHWNLCDLRKKDFSKDILCADSFDYTNECILTNALGIELEVSFSTADSLWECCRHKGRRFHADVSFIVDQQCYLSWYLIPCGGGKADDKEKIPIVVRVSSSTLCCQK